MKKIFYLFGLLILITLFLSRCVISKMRWSDSKAQRVFKNKNVALSINDTVIDGRLIHYAMTGSDSLPGFYPWLSG